MLVDHVADTNGVELHAFAKLYDFPEMVKTADYHKTFKPEGLPPSAYADERRRLFPCHTAASTWLSALYFTEKRGEYQPQEAARVEAKIDKAIDFWDIRPLVDRMLAQHAELHKNAEDSLPDEDFAYVWTDSTGKKHRHWRLKNALDVRKAAEALYNYRDRIPFRERNAIANRILEKAAQYGAYLSKYETFIEKQAGRGLCDPAKLRNAIEYRAKLANDTAVERELRKLADMVHRAPAHMLDPGTLTKLAGLLEDIDRKLGIQYNDTVRPPDEVVFEVTYKEAAEAADDMVPLTTGNVYSKRAFSNLRLADLREVFGADLAREVDDNGRVDIHKLAELASTFPRPDAELFERLLKETGAA